MKQIRLDNFHKCFSLSCFLTPSYHPPYRTKGKTAVRVVFKMSKDESWCESLKLAKSSESDWVNGWSAFLYRSFVRLCVWLKVSGGAMVVTPSSPHPPYEQLLPLPTPCLRYFWKDPLMTPHHPTSSILHCYPLPIHHPSPPPLKILIIHFVSSHWLLKQKQDTRRGQFLLK